MRKVLIVALVIVSVAVVTLGIGASKSAHAGFSCYQYGNRTICR